MTLYDASTMRKEHVLDAVSSVLSDFDVQRNLLVTCGMSSRSVTVTVIVVCVFKEIFFSALKKKIIFKITTIN